jgi:hypothetical protein
MVPTLVRGVVQAAAAAVAQQLYFLAQHLELLLQLDQVAVAVAITASQEILEEEQVEAPGLKLVGPDKPVTVMVAVAVAVAVDGLAASVEPRTFRAVNLLV